MLIEQAFHDELAADAGVSALVRARIYYVRAPQDVEKPYVVIQKISAVPLHAHDGPSGLSNDRFQIDAYAATYSELKSLGAAMQACLDGFTGTMGGSSGVYVGSCFKDNENDGWDEDLRIFSLTVDYLIAHAE